jgi:hypothetical protein
LLIGIVEFGLLGFLLACRVYDWLWIDRLPSIMGGVLPLIVPWAGALGGVTISLVGVARHFRSWDANVEEDAEASGPGFDQRMRWNTWHLTRPFVGAVFGTFAALILVFVLGVIGFTDDGDLDLSPTGAATLMALAFVVGYRERTFRTLVERVVDTVLGPGIDEAAPSYDLTPAALDFGEVNVNSSKRLVLTITNTGSRLLRLEDAHVTGAGFSLVSRVPSVGAGDSNEFVVRFAPRSVGEASGALVVKASGIESTVALKGTGI